MDDDELRGRSIPLPALDEKGVSTAAGVVKLRTMTLRQGKNYLEKQISNSICLSKKRDICMSAPYG